MKKIGYFINTFLRLSEDFIYKQIINIKSFDVEVLCRNVINKEVFPYEAINKIDGKNKILYGIAYLNYTFFRNMPHLEKAINEKNISLIHAHFGIEGTYALKLKNKFNVPLFVTFHGHDITRLPKFVFHPPAWLNYWLHFNELKKQGNIFLAVSDFIKGKLLERGFPPERVRTHYLGLDTKISVLNKIKEGKTILTAGRLVEKKGMEYSILAMSEIVKTNPDVKLLICGEGPLKVKLENLVKKMKLERNVLFLGWQSKKELYSLMQESDIFILPSVTAHDGDCEGLGMVILEAMANELPVVSTWHSGIPEAVVDGQTGFLTKERDYNSLAEKIKILLEDKSLSTTMGKKGKEVVETKFNIEKQVEKLEKMYKEFI